jgi:pimeloyl-ACP methyl ester carboxylesterase
MPVTRNGSVELYWESTGQGPPVLLIAGQGMTMDGWWSTIPILARRFRVIAFDNRDTGRSGRVVLPYSVANMAEDALAVLDAAGVERAHVYGVSLGGMVAQELALHHADRVEALVLGATSPGGRGASLPSPLPMTFFARAGLMGTEEAEWAAVPYTYAQNTRRLHADRIAENIRRRLNTPPNTMAYLHQAAAVATHSTYERLDQITAPTLVIHGEEDLAMPPQNARVLAERIPNAVLKLKPQAGHLYFIDEPGADRDIARFLQRHSAPSPVRELAVV